MDLLGRPVSLKVVSDVKGVVDFTHKRCSGPLCGVVMLGGSDFSFLCSPSIDSKMRQYHKLIEHPGRIMEAKVLCLQGAWERGPLW